MDPRGMVPKVRHVGFDLVAEEESSASTASGAMDIPPHHEYDYTVGKSISPVIIPPVLQGVYQPSISPDEGMMLEDAATQSSLVDTQPIPPPVATTYHQPDSSASKKAPEVRFAEDEGGPISPGAEIRRTMSMADNMQDPAAVEQYVEGTSPTIPIHDSAPVEPRRATKPQNSGAHSVDTSPERTISGFSPSAERISATEESLRRGSSKSPLMGSPVPSTHIHDQEEISSVHSRSDAGGEAPENSGGGKKGGSGGGGVGGGKEGGKSEKPPKKEKGKEKEKRGPPDGIPEKKPALTKAERRAVQEAQRAAKAAAKAEAEGGAAPAAGGGGGGGGGGEGGEDGAAGKGGATPGKGVSKPAVTMQYDDQKRVAKQGKAGKGMGVIKSASTRSVDLFSHLPQYDRHALQESLMKVGVSSTAIHPAVSQLAVAFVDGSVSGSNARCVATLNAFREVIQDYTTPANKTMSRDLSARINSMIAFLVDCRPLSVTMGNAIKYLKQHIISLDPGSSEHENKRVLLAAIDSFIQEKIVFADETIVEQALMKIQDGDKLLVYAYSHVVAKSILHARSKGVHFRVVVVDSHPLSESKISLRQYLQAGISCTYCHINSVSYIIRDVTKVFLGAASVLSNGTVIARVGTAAVAMVAKAFNVPVMILCETYKFHERVQLDSITFNELGDPEELVTVDGCPEVKSLEGWQDVPNLHLLNLRYDAMPADYVTMIITEIGMVPPTSVPVILREYRTHKGGPGIFI